MGMKYVECWFFFIFFFFTSVIAIFIHIICSQYDYITFFLYACAIPFQVKVGNFSSQKKKMKKKTKTNTKKGHIKTFRWLYR